MDSGSCRDHRSSGARNRIPYVMLAQANRPAIVRVLRLGSARVRLQAGTQHRGTSSRSTDETEELAWRRRAILEGPRTSSSKAAAASSTRSCRTGRACVTHRAVAYARLFELSWSRGRQDAIATSRGRRPRCCGHAVSRRDRGREGHRDAPYQGQLDRWRSSRHARGGVLTESSGPNAAARHIFFWDGDGAMTPTMPGAAFA